MLSVFFHLQKNQHFMVPGSTKSVDFQFEKLQLAVMSSRISLLAVGQRWRRFWPRIFYKEKSKQNCMAIEYSVVKQNWQLNTVSSRRKENLFATMDKASEAQDASLWLLAKEEKCWQFLHSSLILHFMRIAVPLCLVNTPSNGRS